MVSSQASCSAVSRMTSLEVSVFCEDRAHEEFVGPFVNRVAAEESCAVHISMRVARGGIGRALSEFRIFQKLVAVLQEPAPDITVVAIDANCKGFATKRKEIASAVRDDYLGGQIVTACPDPHVERWYVADPASCTQVFGAQPRIGKVKCSRGYYKRVLADVVREGGSQPTLGGIEFAREVVAAMDLYRAGRNDPALCSFTNELRAALRTLRN